MMYGINNGWGMGMGTGWIVGIILVILVIWLLARISGQNRSAKIEIKTALDILKERYARGEINKEEYDLRKRDL